MTIWNEILFNDGEGGIRIFVSRHEHVFLHCEVLFLFFLKYRKNIINCLAMKSQHRIKLYCRYESSL